MKYILHRLSPLAVVFVALAGVLALSSTANAQSTAPVQIKSVAQSGAISNLPGGLAIAPDNNSDFRQRWDRELVSSGVFRFKLQGTNACLRVAAGVAPSALGGVALGSCSGTGAQWRRTASPGVGDFYVNVASGHAIAPDFCFGVCRGRVTAVPGDSIQFFEPRFLNWTFDAL